MKKADKYFGYIMGTYGNDDAWIGEELDRVYYKSSSASYIQHSGFDNYQEGYEDFCYSRANRYG